MSAINDGGYAFPMSVLDGYYQTGMTLRDYFAAKAMQGLLSAGRDPQFGGDTIGGYAASAYQLADAMLDRTRGAAMSAFTDEDLMRDVYMSKAQREAYERIAKNAERYRWLRENCRSRWVSDAEEAVQLVHEEHGLVFAPEDWRERLDDAIDSYISKDGAA